MFGRIKAMLRRSLEIQSHNAGPTQREYYRDISAAFVAGYEAAQQNVDIRPVREYLKDYVGD